jgi:ABC-2 type transport system permease protein
MRTAPVIALVTAREFSTRIRSKVFLISTAVILIIVAAAVILPGLIGSDDSTVRYEIGIVGSMPTALAPALENILIDEDVVVNARAFGTRDKAETAMEDGEIDAIVVDGSIAVVENRGSRLAVALAAALTAIDVTERAEELGIDPMELAALLSPDVEVVERDPAKPEEEADAIVAFFGIIILFIAVVNYGQFVLMGVVEEKSSRVVEVVLGAIRPHQLLFGKIFGIGALGLVQLLLVGSVVVGLGMAGGDIELPEATFAAIGAVILWFILGFVFYAAGYAATGALVSRQEEAGSASFPLTFVLMIGYFLSSALWMTPESGLLRIFSFIPPFAPVTMPVRMVAGVAPFWEVAASVGLMLVGTYLVVRLAGRVYAGGLLRVGRKLKWREAWRSAETP